MEERNLLQDGVQSFRERSHQVNGDIGHLSRGEFSLGESGDC